MFFNRGHGYICVDKEGHTVTSRTRVTGTRILLNDGIGLTLDPAF